jgi:hypothetical protein
VSQAQGTRDRGTRRPDALVERATIITIGLGLAVGFKESVLLRLLAEPAAARPGDAYTARTVTPLRNRGGGLFEMARLQVAFGAASPPRQPWTRGSPRTADRRRRTGRGAKRLAASRVSTIGGARVKALPTRPVSSHDGPKFGPNRRGTP